MFAVLSTGKIINLNHVALIEPFDSRQRAIRIRLSTGHHDVSSGCSQEDYDRIVRLAGEDGAEERITAENSDASGSDEDNATPNPEKKQRRRGRPSNALKEAREICDSMGISWETDDTVEELADRIESKKNQNA